MVCGCPSRANLHPSPLYFVTPMDCTTSFPCPSGFFLILWQMEGPAWDKTMRWGSSISWILSAQATEGSAAFLCLTSLLRLSDFSPSLQVGLNSGNSSHSFSFQAHPSWLSIDATHGLFYYLILVLLTLVIFLKRVPHSALQLASLCVPPAPCQEPCGATWFPWEHPLLVLLEPFCSSICLPLRCWCPQDPTPASSLLQPLSLSDLTHLPINVYRSLFQDFPTYISFL